MRRLAQATSTTTASVNSTARRVVARRARSCCSKKPKLLERNLGRLAFLGRLGGDEQLRGAEAEGAGEHHVGEGLALGVVFHHRIVERLAGEGDLVLGAGELLLQAEDILVRLQVRVGLEYREQLAERAAEHAFGLREALHRPRLARRLRRAAR